MVGALVKGMRGGGKGMNIEKGMACCTLGLPLPITTLNLWLWESSGNTVLI